MDITYIPTARDFVYFAAVIDWFSRRVLSWRLSITMRADCCIEAVEEAAARFGRPEIFNTDQGSQFTSTDFTKVLLAGDIKISMDGKGAWRDNVFVERLWKSVKYEEVYLRAYETVSHARASIGRYLDFTTDDALIRAWAGKPRTTPTSTGRFSQRPKSGSQSTHQADETVQTNRATSGDDRRRAQQKLCVYVAAAVKWAKAKHWAGHLAKIAPWWPELTSHEIVSEEAMAQMEGRPLLAPLTAQQVAMVLHVGETNRVMPGRKSLSETTEVAMAALWWVALTAQRMHASYQVIVSRVDDKTATDGWHVVAWLPGAIEGGRHLSLPISPLIYNLTLGRELADIHRRADSRPVFASSRTKVRGKDEHADKPVGDSILNSLLNRLRNKDALGDGVGLTEASRPAAFHAARNQRCLGDPSGVTHLASRRTRPRRPFSTMHPAARPGLPGSGGNER